MASTSVYPRAGSSKSSSRDIPFPGSPPRKSSLSISAKGKAPSHQEVAATYDPHFPSSSSAFSSPTTKRRSRPPSLSGSPSSKTFPSFSLDTHGPLSPLDNDLPLPSTSDSSEFSAWRASAGRRRTAKSTGGGLAEPFPSYRPSSSASSSSSETGSLRGGANSIRSVHSMSSTSDKRELAKDRDRRGSHASVSFGATTMRVFKSGDSSAASGSGATVTTSTTTTTTTSSSSERVYRYSMPSSASMTSLSSYSIGAHGGSTRPHRRSDDLVRSRSERVALRGSRDLSGLGLSIDGFEDDTVSRSQGTRSAPGSRPASRRNSVTEHQYPVGFPAGFSTIASSTTAPSSPSATSAGGAHERKKSWTESIVRGSPARRHSADASTTSPTAPTFPVPAPAFSSVPSSPRLSRRHRRGDRRSARPSSSSQHLSLPHFPDLSLPLAHRIDFHKLLVQPLTPFVLVAFYTFMTSLAALALAIIMAMGFGLTFWDDISKKVRESKGVKGWIEDAKGVVQKAVPAPSSFRSRGSSPSSTPRRSGSYGSSTSQTPTTDTDTASSSSSSWASRVLPHALMEALTFVAADEANQRSARRGRDRMSGGEGEAEGEGESAGEDVEWEEEEEVPLESGVETPLGYDIPGSAPHFTFTDSSSQDDLPSDTKPTNGGGMPRPPLTVLFGSLALTFVLFVGRGLMIWWMEKKRDGAGTATEGLSERAAGKRKSEDQDA